MSKKSRADQLMDSAWLQGGLILLGALMFWWLRRRTQKAQQVEDRPVVWRRDIEMGPAAPIQEADSERDLPTQEENIPQVRAGGGWMEPEGGESGTQVSGFVPDTGPSEVNGPVASEEVTEDETPGGDDLIIIEGIGPKINTILQEAGVRTFRKLANTPVEQLRQILTDAGLRTALSNPETWTEQAQLAADGQWEKLKTLQNSLKGGRRG